MAYRDTILADSPLVYLELEQTSGNPTNSGSFAITGNTISTGVTRTNAGKMGNAWRLPAKADRIAVTWASGDSAAINDSVFSVEAWVKLDASSVADIIAVVGQNISGGWSSLALTAASLPTFSVKGSTTVTVTGPTAIDDGQWHHLVGVANGTTKTLYVDGVAVATSSSSHGTMTLAAHRASIGNVDNTTSAIGTYDEFAVYGTALSESQVVAHYDAGNGPAAVNAGYTAQPMTAAADMPNATGMGNIQTVVVTDDAKVTSGQATTNYGSDTSLSMGAANSAPVFMKFAAHTGNEFEASKTLYLWDTFGNSTMALSLYSVEADWSESTITWANKPAVTFVRTTTIPSGGAGWEAVDITGVDKGHGIMLAASSGSFNSSENAANKPYALVATSPPVSVSTVASPLTASAAMPPAVAAGGTGASLPAVTPMTASASIGNATVSTGSSLSINVAPMYATADMPNAIGAAEKYVDVAVTAEPMSAQAAWPTESGFSLTIKFDAEPMTASAEIVNVSAAVQRGPKIAAAPMIANAIWKQPSAVNGSAIAASEVDDKFFQRVKAALPSIWYRLNDLGSTAVDRMNPTGPKGYYEGVQTGQFNAPDGRHSVHFDGTARIRQDEPVAAEAGGANSTLEFSFRTDKANQFLMVTADNRAAANSNTPMAPRELFLSNGRIGYRYYSSVNGVVANPTEFLGFRNLADGEWHTVVIRSTDVGQVNDNFVDGVEIYVDGKFEVRRAAAARWTGFPDYIGSRPERIDSGPIGNTDRVTMPLLPSSQNFVGDMSEVVFFNSTLSAHQISRMYYDFMGWTPIEAEPMEVFGFTPADHRGRGNQKRALYLWWDAEQDAYAVAGGGVGLHDTMNFDPVIAGHGVNGGVYNLEGYKVFSRGIVGNYRDAVYDMPTLLDLDTHLDVEDYDVIMFGDWPDEGYEEDRLRNTIPNFTADKERLIRQLREANDKGIGLLVTHPRLAVDLGIVDRVEFVPTLKESKSLNGGQGNAGGLYDYGSAVKFPWNITNDAALSTGPLGGAGTGEAQNMDPSHLAYKAYFYEDMNFNNKFRVRATVEGLTDIPSYIIKDAVFHIDYDMWGDYLNAYNMEDRRNGLLIGDEFIFHGTNPAGMDWEQGQWEGYRAGRPKGYYATPVANVKAGTVVTTFGATHWRDQSLVANPYKDYATTIVLDKGDTLVGRSVGGRIFVNFTEQPNRFHEALIADILPGSQWDDGSAVWPNAYNPDTAAQRDWEFSWTRINASNVSVGGRLVETTVVMPDGSTLTTRASSSGGLVSANYTSLFGKAYVPRWDMTRRGMWWVGRGERAQEGEKRVAATPLVATAEMPEPVVTAQRDAGYVAQPMAALGQMPKVKEDQSGDVDVVTLPMTATAEFTGFSRVISAAPMLATAELVENFDMVHASGEQVVLTLHGVDATLYLKEEA